MSPTTTPSAASAAAWGKAVSGRRKVAAHAATGVIVLVVAAAVIPLASLLWTVVSRGWRRLDADFFSMSMRGIVGPGGGAIHALTGTLLITAAASVVAIPLGILSAIYLVEYGRGPLRRVITFLVDVMTGIPSIVAGLFAYAVLSLLLGPGARSGVAAAGALVVLMLPVVIRTSEEMLRLVPNDVREASAALGAPYWRTITTVVLPTAFSGLVSGALLGVARIIGETAPLLLVAGFTDSMNRNLFDGRMATLPVFIYSQWQNKGANAAAYDDRAWAAALLLVVTVLLLNLGARAMVTLLSRTPNKKASS